MRRLNKNKSKNRKMSFKEIADKFNIGATNIIANETPLRAGYENLEVKGYKHVKREKHQKK